jgi:hypothetical protein
MPKFCNLEVTSDGLLSDPETLYPEFKRISAIPLMPAPPIPIK